MICVSMLLVRRMAFVVRWNAVNATAFCDVAEAIENIDLQFEGHWMAVVLSSDRCEMAISRP